jgi:molybdopterin-guanine dinucleotide biosynthesis protein A
MGTVTHGAIVAGGGAVRLEGIAKGLEMVGGVRIVDRVARALGSVVDELVMVVAPSTVDPQRWHVSYQPRAAAAGTATDMPIIRDMLDPGPSASGSAAGVHAALKTLGAPALVVAWDLPFVTRALLASLLAHAHATSDADAVVFAGAEPDSLEPLCAWYAPRCADVIEAHWNAGERSLHAVLRRVRTRVIPREALRAFGDPDILLWNVNTPDDLVRARALVTV